MASRSRDVLDVQSPAPRVTDEVLLIPVQDIELGERLRPVDPVWAEALGRIMQAETQRTPIEVCRLPGKSKYTVVSGGHRRVGAEAVGMAYLRAIVVTSDRADRRMREISENLWRKDLEPVDRAAFVAELVALHKVRNGVDPDADGRAVSAQMRWQKALQNEADDTTATIAVAYGWAENVGEQVGLSVRTVRDDLLLHRRLAPQAVERLREHRHPVLKNASQLRALAKLEAMQQTKAVDRLLDGAKSVSDAVASRSPKSAASPDDKRLSAFIGAFSRMSLVEKKGAMTLLFDRLPDGMLRELVPTPKAAPNAYPKYRDALIEAIAEIREIVDGLIEDEVIGDGPVAIVDYERVDRLRKAEGALQLAAMPLFGDHVPMGSEIVTRAHPQAQKIERLKGLVALIEGADRGDEQQARALIDTLERDHGGKADFNCGAERLRLAGVTATCTHGRHGLVKAWLRAADRALHKLEGSAQ